jgi:hypothetical protein
MNYAGDAVEQPSHTDHSGAHKGAKRYRLKLFDPVRKSLLEGGALPKVARATADAFERHQGNEESPEKSEGPNDFQC